MCFPWSSESRTWGGGKSSRAAEFPCERWGKTGSVRFTSLTSVTVFVGSCVAANGSSKQVVALCEPSVQEDASSFPNYF